MKASEYRDRTLEELRQMAEDLKQDVFNLKFQHATGQLDDVSKLTQTKRNLARVKTIIREHELGRHKLLTVGDDRETSRLPRKAEG
jgi:large subunit ribosomal protein L29